jgi:thiamine thiazole synthase
MWGGAMLFNQIVVQNQAKAILDEFAITYQQYDDTCLTCDSVHATSALIYAASKAGAIINNGFIVEDVVFQEEKVAGVVVNWSTVIRQGLHVDPLVIMAKRVLDGTGHPCEVTTTVAKKNNIKLNTPSGQVQGERSLSVEEGEEATVKNTKEVYPGLFVSGMAANGVSGSFRMGPIFGGMLLSGQKVAQLIIESLDQ